MKYEKDLMAEWDDYAIKQTLVKKGREEEKRAVVIRLLNTGRFTIAEIANFASISEAYVHKVKKELKK